MSEQFFFRRSLLEVSAKIDGESSNVKDSWQIQRPQTLVHHREVLHMQLASFVEIPQLHSRHLTDNIPEAVIRKVAEGGQFD